MGQQLPASVVLRHDNGRYSIDADKSFDTGIETNILAHYVRPSSSPSFLLIESRARPDSSRRRRATSWRSS